MYKDIIQFIKSFKKTTILGISILILHYRDYCISYNIEISNRNEACDNNYSNIQHYTNQITHKQPVSFIQEVKKIVYSENLQWQYHIEILVGKITSEPEITIFMMK